ncbi:cell division cycle and apoptosis regulator protein 1 [Senna tora]|uniref:Cell division cycle and apoptosis regulator protein 1 n=1 Tax=Senna tora TaxID=362788 RepID=A0A834TTR0_9FABA|nr:cell division cycle and apoptosis regulator protein 1 [Senna tora]
MYSSRGTSGYGQSYSGQSAYVQNLGTGYSGGSVGGPDVGQHSVASRHSGILGGSQEVDVGGYRAHSSTAAQYGGQYSSVYGSATLSSAQQVPSLSAKGAGTSALESRGGYALSVSDSPKFASGEYAPSSSHGYGHKSDQLYGDKVLDYSGIDRRQYGERQSAYIGRDLQSDPTGRYTTDSVGYGHQHQQPEIYDRIDQAALLRPEQLLKAQSLQSASLDGSTRQTDYLAARAAASRHTTQDLLSYGGRMDTDTLGSSMLSATSYSGQHTPSILGAAPRRNVDDLLYSQSTSNPGYGVSLPPGRDYASGKGLHGSGMESDYTGSVLSRAGHNEHKDDRAGYLREFELREEERRREHLRERERDREREREKERERLRERDRERARERERLERLERREKEERKRKRALEARRERSPVRLSKDPRATSKGPRGASKDPRGASLTKEGRSSRRDSPHHSPVKEKRREYVCKVYPSSLVETERDYLSLDKRYPRLFVSPEFTKAVVNWAKGNLKLSIHTPVSFEHDFVEEECAAEPKDLSSTKLLVGQPSSSEQRNTVWNAKIILLSGLSRSAMEDMASDKNFDDRIPHICNILRFAVLKKDHSFMAVGGPWESADGGDPSIDDNSLIRTALRYAKNVIQLDLQNCQRWNRFLEIHYDRLGKDGLFSHKEITVLFVPDLSDCLPSLDVWRNQWLAHKNAVTEREHQLSLKREKSRDNKEALKDKSEKKDSPASGQAEDVKKEKSSNNVRKETVEKSGEINNRVAQIDGADNIVEGKSAEKKEPGESASAKTTGSVKSVKKKVIKKVVKQKVTNKTNATASKQLNKSNENDNADKMTSTVPTLDEKSSVDLSGDNASAKMADMKDASAAKTDGNELKDKKETNSSDNKPQDKPDLTVNAVNDSGVKMTKKKKIIKRVPKRKVAGGVSKQVVSDPQNDGNIVAQADTQNTAKQTIDADNPAAEVNKTEKPVPKKKTKPATAGKQDNVAVPNKTETKSDMDGKKVEKGTGEKSGAEIDKQKASEKDIHNGKGKLKGSDKLKDVKVTKERDGKDESKSKSSKEIKEKRKSDEPPRHPGFILQTKWSKESKLRSLSLSLDSLLDYTDKDIEESTFELSLFAESLHEMLQYQMGCRIFTFLQKLRIKFVMKRNQRKRQREDEQEKENVEKSPLKRPKGDDSSLKTESTNLEASNTVQADDDKTAKDDNSIAKDDDVKMEDGTEEEEEDPEEDPEEYEEMESGSPQHDSASEKNAEQKTSNNVEAVDNKEADESSKEQPKVKEEVKESKSDAHFNEEREEKNDKNNKETHAVKESAVDKELLQAFRFFDRNRAGYIRVEDMRLIIHNLGRFLSHRDVKELVQSALLESNTGRDDRILYNKLVRMTEI